MRNFQVESCVHLSPPASLVRAIALAMLLVFHGHGQASPGSGITEAGEKGTRPANDDFESAITIEGLDTTVNGDNIGATTQQGEIFDSRASTSVWYRCPVGSGAMESTCSQLQGRFKRTGQFWTEEGKANLMSLELARRNGDWPDLWRYHPEQM